MPRFRLICCVFSAATALPAFGNYADDTGYNQLKAELGAALPTGNSVGMTQVEATPATAAYLPEAGIGTFAGTGYWTGKSFTAKSGPGILSDHAFFVGEHLYGSNTDPDRWRASMSPAVVNIDNWNANDWQSGFLSPGGQAPVVETKAVQNHSWVNDATAANAITIRDLVRRQDFSVNRDNYVCCVGLNNGESTPINDVFASAYNVISVGRSDGIHSRGTTTSDMDGAGRRKPEIVAPLDATSFATPYVSSAAALLREKADLINTANARKAKTLKAVLLAGATKGEFPLWEKSATHPIDSIFGAGELNVYNSYFILDGGEQPAGAATARPDMAWDNQSLNAAGTADYRLTVPAGMYGAELSAFIVWHRTLTNTTPPLFTLQPDSLVNFDLTLLRDPSAGGAAVTLDSSTSTLYNIEHVWKKNLPAGNYRLRVSRGAGSAHDYSIAWRLMNLPHQPLITFAFNGANIDFTFTGLLLEQPYKFQSSADLSAWTDLTSFTATAVSRTFSTPRPAGARAFFRLLPVPL
ncbi:MAG TPA: hypothetical protein VG796_15210 [Verrucomicrobiales bacterium]|nr:hypothetical protein [Verrucomicrobiales bacterium]